MQKMAFGYPCHVSFVSEYVIVDPFVNKKFGGEKCLVEMSCEALQFFT